MTPLYVQQQYQVCLRLMRFRYTKTHHQGMTCCMCSNSTQVCLMRVMLSSFRFTPRSTTNEENRRLNEKCRTKIFEPKRPSARGNLVACITLMAWHAVTQALPLREPWVVRHGGNLQCRALWMDVADGVHGLDRRSPMVSTCSIKGTHDISREAMQQYIAIQYLVRVARTART